MSKVQMTRDVRVHSITYQSETILAYELRSLVPVPLVPTTAGAHVDLHLANGIVRSYSLVNKPGESYRYVIAVQKSEKSRGGSRFIHDQLKVGATVAIGQPRNNFDLVEAAPHSVLIAGGIGITPLWSMIQGLEQLGRSWELHYAARSGQRAAFLEDLVPKGDRVALYFGESSDQPKWGRKRLDIDSIVQRTAADTHMYCCGPAGMIRDFQYACSARDPATVHVENFGASELPAQGGFCVVLARSGLQVVVPQDKTILDVLLDHGVEADYSCREGVCGSCETPVLEGTPDHRDLVLSQAERDTGKVMMICCSGCKGDRLTLDL